MVFIRWAGWRGFREYSRTIHGYAIIETDGIVMSEQFTTVKAPGLRGNNCGSGCSHAGMAPEPPQHRQKGIIFNSCRMPLFKVHAGFEYYEIWHGGR